MKVHIKNLIMICSLFLLSTLSFAQGPGEPFHQMTANGAHGIASYGHIMFWQNPEGTLYNEVYLSDDSSLVASLDTTVRIYNGYPSTADTSLDISVAGFLNSLHKYYWRVVEYDSSGATMGNVSNFITRIDLSFQPLLFDDFTNGDGNWSITNEGGDCVWMTADISSDSYQLPPEASGNIFTANSDLCGPGTFMSTSAVYHKEFYEIFGDLSVIVEWDNDWRTLSLNDSASVEISMDNGNSWEVSWSRYGVDERNSHEMAMAGTIFNGMDLMVKFHTVQPDWDWWWAIDNVQIYLVGPLETNDPPNFLEVFSNNNTVPQVNLSWDAAHAVDTITGYLLQRKQGLPTDTAGYVNIVQTDANTFNYTDFDVLPNEIYTYKILTVTGVFYSIWGNEATAYIPQIVPVELTSFTANAINNEVQLFWQTATETNNQGFAIERKHISGDWLRIGFIEGNGTTTEPQNYSFVDNSISSGKYQYRLKQIDFNGTYEYSKIVEVEITAPTKYSLEQNYPNPFNPTTTIKYSIKKAGLVTLKVYDILGKEITTLVNENKTAGNYSVNFNASNLPSGIYFYRLKSGSFLATKKLIFMK